jgi:mono/diheme cytochrome c family protein
MAMRMWKLANRGPLAGAMLVLAACTAQQEGTTMASTPSGDHAAADASVPAGAPRPTGASIAAMSDQYAHPRPGPVAAAGASAWVAPAPAPAFVLSTPLPPADPPPPPLAAVANRQPAPSAPAAAAPSVRPAPASPVAAASAPLAAADIAKGRQLFAQYGCGGCHVLADGGGAGGVGPSLDNNPRLTHDYVVGAISEGRGAMPAFRDQMSATEIATLAAYVVGVARK